MITQLLFIALQLLAHTHKSSYTISYVLERGAYILQSEILRQNMFVKKNGIKFR